LASFGNPNSIRFSPGNSGAITVRLANQFKLANSTHSISAQVTAGPHRPWYNNEYIFVANVPHNTKVHQNGRRPVRIVVKHACKISRSYLFPPLRNP